MIFVPDILNTPIGKIIRHNWLKNDKMYVDLNYLLNKENLIDDDLLINLDNILDDKCFPNEILDGYEYFN